MTRLFRLRWLDQVSTADIPDDDDADRQTQSATALEFDLKTCAVEQATATEHIQKPDPTMPSLIARRVVNETAPLDPVFVPRQAAKLQKPNKRHVHSSDRARQVRDCLVCGYEPDAKVRLRSFLLPCVRG